MNKFLKYTLISVTAIVATTQAAKFARKNQYIQNVLKSYQNKQEFDQLKSILLSIIEAFREETNKRQEEPHVEEPFTKAEQPQSEQSISQAIKEALDGDTAKALIDDESDRKLMKDLVEESEQIEKLIRGWFKG
ncbi:hypothetical protein [Abyssicoccus albus]|uniref:hypothetical protein n=1 Tax=Abyssicoccus albus TaxID=1817405 RepID=UPI000F4EA09D|nr:hypothetical protein [Abyssicoccus albus]